MRNLIIGLPPVVMVAALFAVFCAVAVLVRRVVLRRCDDEAREELAEQANNLLTGVSATFAFFIGFAISISWGAVSAAQNAVEQQATAVQQMAWELRNIPDKAQTAALTEKLRAYATAAADQDPYFLARGRTVNLPSAAPLDDFETALHDYVSGPGTGVRGTDSLTGAVSKIVASSSAVNAVANRSLPRPMAVLLFVVAILVTAVMGITTVTLGRRSMGFVYGWCLIPALSLTVVAVLAFPFALRSGLTLAPMKAAAQQLSGG